MKKILCLLLCFIACFCCFCGCANGPIYERIGLEEAVEQGLITTEQVKSIAYYWNYRYTENPPEPDFELIPKKKLSKKTVKNIKRSFLYHQGYPDKKIRNVENYKYYGTYNGYAVAIMQEDFVWYDLIIDPEKILGGVIFYNYSGRFYAYKIAK